MSLVEVNETETKYSEPKQAKPKKKKGKIKKVGKFLSITALVAALGFGSYKVASSGFNIKDWFKTGSDDAKLANSLVAEYTVDGVFNSPETVVINRAYDIRYCDGENFASALTSAGVKYCEVFDEYYTLDGSDIAVITLEGQRVEVVDANIVEIDGVIICMPPEGYELEGDKGVKTVKETIVKVVPKSPTGDYSGALLDNIRDYEIVNVDERSTKTFSEMNDMVLIVDVPDNAVLVNNQCEGALNLVPKIR